MRDYITPLILIRLDSVSGERHYCTDPTCIGETYQWHRYEVCKKYGIGYRNTGKWIVAQTPEQGKYLTDMHEHAKRLDVPTRFVSMDELKREEQEVCAKEAVLESSSTGIVDSHGLMMYLLGQFEDRGGDVAYQTTVT